MAWSLLPEATGLLLAAWVSASVEIPLRRSPGGVVVWAIGYSALALAVNAAAVWTVSYLVPVSSAFALRSAILRSSAAAVWFPCVLIFSSPRSVWVWIPMVLLGINLARVAASHRPVDSPGLAPALTRAGLGPMRLPPRRLPPFLASASLQVAVIAGMTRHARMAAVFAALSAGFLLWSFPPVPARKEGTLKPILSTVLSVTISVLFSMVALASLIAKSGGFGGDYTISDAILRAIFGDPARGTAQARRPQPLPGDPDSISHGGGLSSVILVPESKPQAILLAPPPAPLQGFTRLPSREPLRLAFHGVYWFYKPPYSRPPKYSFSTRGSPVKTSLRSSDEYPLLMAAHQAFSTPVDLGCCTEIQVGISNADRNPGTVSLELVLTDSRSTGDDRMKSITLKPQPVTSTLAPEPGKDPDPVREVLNFPIPGGGRIRQFDEITIRYRLSPERARRSARIEIEDFVFTPRQR